MYDIAFQLISVNLVEVCFYFCNFFERTKSRDNEQNLILITLVRYSVKSHQKPVRDELTH